MKKRACQICGADRPLDRAHIIPKRFVTGIKGYEHLAAFDGPNILILCSNHHVLLDRFQLSEKEFDLIWPQVEPMMELFATTVLPSIFCIDVKTKKIQDGKTRERRQQMLSFITKYADAYGGK